MGSSLSPALANLFMELLELKFPPGLFGDTLNYFRYVDDTLVVLDRNVNQNECLNVLNNLNENVKFTLEGENETDSSLNFLDLKIYRMENFWKFKIFRKATNNEKYIHWFSYHDVSVKRGVLFGQILRAYRVCDPEFLSEELDHIKNTFMKLSYPEVFIRSVTRAVRRKIYNPLPKNQEKIENYLILPCPPSELLKNSISKEINIVTRQTHKLSSYFMTPKHLEDEQAGIYRIPCENCNKSYIGETDNFNRRMKQHLHSLNTGDENSTLHQHRNAENHRIDLRKAKIIKKMKDPGKRKFLEGCMINSVDCFNLRRDNMNSFQVGLLNELGTVPRIHHLD
jgi:predicted GIY-YIG superfamily endonuclease